MKSKAPERPKIYQPKTVSLKNRRLVVLISSIIAVAVAVSGYFYAKTVPEVLADSAKQIYYSVGQNTNDHKTGSPIVTIANGIATFSVAQTAANMGVGDRVTYNGSTIAYISGKISQTQWIVVTKTGGTPANISNAAVNSIRHEFSSLFEALSYYRNPPKVTDASHLNTGDLVAGNYILNIPLYYDTGPEIVTGSESKIVALTGYYYKTGSNNYIKIYTPLSASTEVNQSQRHSGKWDSQKYNIEFRPAENDISAIRVYIPYVKIDGLQIKIISSHRGNIGIETSSYSSGGWEELSNNIITGQISQFAIGLKSGFHSSNTTLRIWNNLVYDLRGTVYGSSAGIVFNACYNGPCGTAYIYNNTIVNNQFGITNGRIYDASADGTMVARNNIVQDADSSNGAGYQGNFQAASGYNISNKNDAPGSNSKNNTTVSFVNKAGKDFHLASGDTAAKNAGTNLFGDANLPFPGDIDDQSRTAPWDIGADEITAPPSPPPVLNAPSSSCSGDTPQVTLSWSASVDAASYSVYRNGSSYQNVGLATAFTDTAVSSGASYSYFIRALNAGGQTDSVAQAVTAVWCEGNIIVQASLDGNPWNGAVSYRLFGPGLTIQGNSAETTHSDKDLGSWTLDYQSGGPGGSSFSNITPLATQTLASGQITKPVITFTANFTASPPGPFILNTPDTACVGTSPQVNLSWSASVDAASYSVYRNGSSYQNVGLATAFTDTAVSSGASYSYFIRALNAGGQTDSVAQAVTAVWCEGNIIVQASLDGNPWNGAVSYRLFGPGLTIQGNSAETTHSDKDLGSWTLDYQSGGPGGSPTISPASVQTLPSNQTARPSIAYALQFVRPPAPDPDLVPPPPTNPENFVQCRTITIYWIDNSSDETGFRIYRRQNNGGSNLSDYTLVATLAADQTSFQDTPPNAEVPYYYIVTAINGAAESVVGQDWPLGPVAVIVCAPNMSGSSKVVDTVNGASYIGQTLRNADIIGFKVIIRNNGTSPAYNVYVVDTLSANLLYQSNARLDTDGPAGNAPANIPCSQAGQVITCNSAQNLGDKPAGSPDWVLTFSAKINDPNPPQPSGFFENTARIRYGITDAGPTDETATVTTGLVPFRTGTGTPEIREIGP